MAKKEVKKAGETRNCTNCNHNLVCAVTKEVFMLIFKSQWKHQFAHNTNYTPKTANDWYESLANCCIHFERM